MYRYYICMYVYVYDIYSIYVINIQRELIGSQLYIMTYTCFPHIKILSTLKNCCYIKDQKSMHLAQHLNVSIKSVFYQAGKENKTGLYFILDVDQQNTSSKFHSDFGSFILHPCIKLMTNKLQPLPGKVPESSVWYVVIIYFSAAWNIHQS